MASKKTEETIEQIAGRIQPLVQGNSKLGRNLIWHFSMLAILTCPGRSALCENICYALGFLFKQSEKWAKARMLMRNQLDFVFRVSVQIRANFVKVLRIHVAGDFDSVEYIRKWIEIAQKHKTVTFYGYTRSWQVSELIPALEELASLPNVYLWYSCDKDTGQPIQFDGVRHAYLATNDYDLPDYQVDLIFRDKPPTYQTHMANALVCVEERGKRPNHKPGMRTGIQCEQCQLCFGKRTAALDTLNRRIKTRQLPVLQGGAA